MKEYGRGGKVRIDKCLWCGGPNPIRNSKGEIVDIPEDELWDLTEKYGANYCSLECVKAYIDWTEDEVKPVCKEIDANDL